MLSDEEHGHPHGVILCGCAFIYPYGEENLEHSLYIYIRTTNHTNNILTRNVPVTMRVPKRNQY